MKQDKANTESLKRLTSIASKIFKLDAESISINSNTQNTENWDSLNHLKLILAVEEEFDIRFLASEILEMSSVKELVKKIDSV